MSDTTDWAWADAEHTKISGTVNGKTYAGLALTDARAGTIRAAISDGLEMPEYVAPVVDLKIAAQFELNRTDVAWGARLAEDAAALAGGSIAELPQKAQEKITYRQALRQIINGTDTESTTLPDAPATN